MKKSCVAYLLLLLLIPHLSSSEEDLIAYWSFDDETANDHSGNGYHGTIVFTPNFVQGISGKAIYFQGRGYYSRNDNITRQNMGDHVLLPNIDFEALKEFTISLWVKEDDMSSEGGEGYFWFGHVQEQWLGLLNHVFYGQNQRYIHATVGSYDTRTCISTESNTVFRNHWFKYDLVYDGTFLKFYINGNRISQKQMDIDYSKKNGALARHWWNYDGEERTSARFTGAMDEVKIYKRALTDEELSIDSIPCRTWINYPNFNYTRKLNMAARAKKQDSLLTLTGNSINEIGVVWYADKIPINESFQTEFSFIFDHGNNFNNDDGSLPGADGIAFVIQNESSYSIGSYGGDIGYGGMNNAVAIEYDTYHNGPQQIVNYNDPNGNHIAVQIPVFNKISAKHSPENTLAINDKILEIKNGKRYYSRIEYNHIDKNLKVYISENNFFFLLSPVIEINQFSLPDYIGNDEAYIGFTSATGSATERHNLLHWTFCSDAQPISSNPNPSSIFNDIIFHQNPVNDVLRLSIPIEIDVLSFEILNTLGQSIIVRNIISDRSGLYEINTSSLVHGLYFINVYSKLRNYQSKFIKL